MKLTGLLKTSVLISLLGMSAMMYAQEQREDAKPEEPRPEATKPARDEAKPPRQQEEKNPRHEEGKPARNEEKAGNQERGHNAQRADGRRGGHIPDEKFRAHFGRQHTVVINRPTIVEGEPRFQVGGFWFTIVDAWPGDWAYTDECYIDYVDGEYFLFDLFHPGVRVALFVVL